MLIITKFISYCRPLEIKKRCRSVTDLNAHGHDWKLSLTWLILAWQLKTTGSICSLTTRLNTVDTNQSWCQSNNTLLVGNIASTCEKKICVAIEMYMNSHSSPMFSSVPFGTRFMLKFHNIQCGSMFWLYLQLFCIPGVHKLYRTGTLDGLLCTVYWSLAFFSSQLSR